MAILKKASNKKAEKTANKKPVEEKAVKEKMVVKVGAEQMFGQTNEPAITEDEKIKIGFEKLEDLDREIKTTERKINELNPMVKEENNAGDRDGMHVLMWRELLRKLEKLRGEKNVLTVELIARREPLTDPVKAVKEKYQYTRDYQHSMYLLQEAAKKFHELKEILGAFISLASIHRQVIPTYLETLAAGEYNCLHVLQYMQPRDAQTFNEEMKQAQELVTKLRQEAAERARLGEIYLS